MEFVQLTAFLRAAEQGNVSRAANLLHLTQPAVTKQIHGLEDELGTRLFDRNARGVTLTETGAILQDHARRCIREFEEARNRIRAIETGESGALTIGAGVTTSIFHLPVWLAAFRAKLPKVEISIRTGTSAEIYAMILARETDLGFVTSPLKHPSLNSSSIVREEIVLVLPVKHSLAQKTISPEMLRELPLILFPRETGFRQYLDAQLTRHDIVPSVKMESDSVEAIKSFVAAGLGASFLPLCAVRGEIEREELIQGRCFRRLRLTRTTCLVHRKDRYLALGARMFREVVRS